ncbi:hypothetical protein F383_11585 [Gossypium arboreum]|uniref:Uncharacterized protein n=1 Tax=Gossypium arboreum TaxID=29729 RepID=A0A0B0NER4_GOSAR|nr:hypothetical protein F383_11585 [Gossypium arboreum]
MAGSSGTEVQSQLWGYVALDVGRTEVLKAVVRREGWGSSAIAAQM